MADSKYEIRVMIVDDLDINREFLGDFITDMGCRTKTYDNATAAYDDILNYKPDLIISDVMMPGMDGIEFLTLIKGDITTANIPVLMISGMSEIEKVAECIRLGADDFLPKPFNSILLHARVMSSLDKKRLRDMENNYREIIENDNAALEQKVKSQVREISSAQLGTIFAMAKLAESRDDDTGEHLLRVSEFCGIIADDFMAKNDGRIDEDFKFHLCSASALHDIGKVGIKDSILLKPGKLTEQEFSVMKMHTTIGRDTLIEVNESHPGNEFIRIGIEVTESHHERWDGKGYPYGKAREDIPLSARILALADVYDALRSHRCYKKALSHEASMSIISEQKGAQFDPMVIDSFMSNEDKFREVYDSLKGEAVFTGGRV